MYGSFSWFLTSGISQCLVTGTGTHPIPEKSPAFYLAVFGSLMISRGFGGDIFFPKKKSFFHGVSSPESWMILKLQDFGVRFGIPLAFPGGPIFRWSIVKLGGGFKCFLCSPRKLEKISNSTNIFQMGWNHQLVNFRGVNVHPVKMLNL